MRQYGVVIVTYNRLNLLKECIKCVCNQSYPVSRLIIIDNASTDGTVDYLKLLEKQSEKAPKYTMVYNYTNKGGAGGFADGVYAAGELTELDYITLIDDDAMLEKDYIKNIDEMIEINPDIKAYSGSVYVNGIIDVSHRRRWRSKLLVSFDEVGMMEYNSRSFEYDLTSFCGVTIERKLMVELGLPLAEYFIRYDDTEYSLRIRKRTKILNVNASIIDHKTVMQNLPVPNIDYKLYYDVRNRIDMARRHLGWGSVMVLYVRAVGQIAMALAKCLVNWNNKDICKHEKEIRVYYCRALRDFHKRKYGKNMLG